MFNFHKHRGIYDSLAHLPFWILWKIWKSRNYLVFQRKTRNWQCELREARQEAEEWSIVGDTTTINHRQGPCNNTGYDTNRKRWKRPREGWVKM